MREHLESDLGTAAFLIVRGFRLLGLVPNGSGRYAFRFEDGGEKAGGTAMAYLQGATVSARALMDAQKTLKTLLYSRKNGDRNGTTNRNRR